MVAILSEQHDVILAAVQAMYTAVAREPDAPYHFPVGRAACELAGYPSDLLDELPPLAVESFAGVAFPFAANVIEPGDTVLDIGSGSGTDVLVAQHMVGPHGRVIALDFTPAMLEKLERVIGATDAHNVRPLHGNAEHIPLPDASVDVVTSNGVLNLVPDKPSAFREIQRVLRPGGRLQLGDIALGKPIDTECRNNPQLWAECVVGATLEDQYVSLLTDAGFEQIEVIGRFDYFAASSSAETRSIARSFRAYSLVLRAAKPPVPQLRAAAQWPTSAPIAITDDVSLPHADRVFDAQGRTCGTIEPLLKTQLKDLQTGQVLEVTCDDPAARLGIPSWSRLTGHRLLAAIEEDDVRTRFYLEKK